MKAIYLLCFLLVLQAYTFAQNKVSAEEKKARLAWVQKQLKNIPQGAEQKDIEKILRIITQKHFGFAAPISAEPGFEARSSSK
ncbi:MAG: hypothetical protein HF314_07805 [Ignavibacteria bacterium]|jgi:hypothetical protein|nr:hypothetical protein [Ignavibacteria bacterium]MCU7502962.1 hypothetical protein [Ignavibacteria bacterium]MCU7517055.1 hypothetical protein [Ignavibacteria bacterium]